MCAAGIAFSTDATAQSPAPADTQPVRVTGTVYDSVSARPLSGATVQMVREGDALFARSVTADSLGAFTIDRVRPGRYLVGFLHPVVDALAIEPPIQLAVITGGGPVQLELATPSAARIRAAICGPAVSGDSSGALVGVVRDADSGAPLPGAKVVLTWRQLTFDATGLRVAERRAPSTARADGAYTVCGAPTGVEIVASAETPGRTGGLIELRIPPRSLLYRDIALGDSASAVAAVVTDSAVAGIAAARRVVRRGTARLAGVVRDSAGQPLSDATVVVVGTSSMARSGADGRFLLDKLPAGTYSLEARAIGYGLARVPVDLASGTTRSTSVRLSRPPTTLSAVVVNAKRDMRTRRYDEFLRRQRSGMGRYVTAEQLARQNPIYTTDALRMIPGIRVTPTGSGFGQTVVARANCEPTVYIDGMRMYGGASDLDAYLQPNDIAGIEVYTSPAGKPPQFEGACAIAVWTK